MPPAPLAFPFGGSVQLPATFVIVALYSVAVFRLATSFWSPTDGHCRPCSPVARS
jgi:hypothetical protein